MKAIVVDVKGKKMHGTVADESTLVLASANQIDTTIAMGVSEIVAMLGGDMVDPTQKHCSRCVKMGRVPYHTLDNFSLLKNGKRHSQCKVCRTEQSAIWCAKRADHRKAYHKEYHKGKPRRVILSKTLQVLMDGYNDEPVDTNAKIDTTESLFVGFPSAVDIQETN